MSESDKRLEEANAQIAKQADDKAARWHALFNGTATPEQRKRVLADLRQITFADQCPAHLAGYEPNRTFHFTGRQAVWREIEVILKNEPPTR